MKCGPHDYRWARKNLTYNTVAIAFSKVVCDRDSFIVRSGDFFFNNFPGVAIYAMERPLINCFEIFSHLKRGVL